MILSGKNSTVAVKEDKTNYLGLMPLERRKISLRLFKIMKGCMMLTQIFFVKLDDSGRRGHDQKLLKRDLDLT